MRKIGLSLLMVVLLCAIGTGCSSGASPVTEETASVEVPDYVLVDKGDVSTAQMSRETFWVATEESIDEEGAKAIAIDVTSSSKDIDEVTVWIYDDENAAMDGLIMNKMYDVVLSKGKVTDTIKNKLYDFE